ncbi:MAG: hypothetical protein Q9M97_10290 [Candidatus Gracilibacteria bacterium]|nr:hypothetical protein [Candidatus Gracilibacteria bacterium]
MIEEAGKRGEKLPKNLEEFDKFVEAKIIEKEMERLKKEDPEYKPNKEELKKIAKESRKSNPNYTKSALTNYNSVGQKYSFEKNPNNKANMEMITNAKNSLPEGSKARAMLEEAEKYIGLNENNPSDNKKLRDLLGFDPAKTPWL